MTWRLIQMQRAYQYTIQLNHNMFSVIFAENLSPKKQYCDTKQHIQIFDHLNVINAINRFDIKIIFRFEHDIIDQSFCFQNYQISRFINRNIQAIWDMSVKFVKRNLIGKKVLDDIILHIAIRGHMFVTCVDVHFHGKMFYL